LCELRDGLVVIVYPFYGLVGTLNKGHRTQIVVTAVVTGVAPSVRNCSRKCVFLS
jgi:hypothetical protein